MRSSTNTGSYFLCSISTGILHSLHSSVHCSCTGWVRLVQSEVNTMHLFQLTCDCRNTSFLIITIVTIQEACGCHATSQHRCVLSSLYVAILFPCINCVILLTMYCRRKTESQSQRAASNMCQFLGNRETSLAFKR